MSFKVEAHKDPGDKKETRAILRHVAETWFLSPILFMWFGERIKLDKPEQRNRQDKPAEPSHFRHTLYAMCSSLYVLPSHKTPVLSPSNGYVYDFAVDLAATDCSACFAKLEG